VAIHPQDCGFGGKEAPAAGKLIPRGHGWGNSFPNTHFRHQWCL